MTRGRHDDCGRNASCLVVANAVGVLIYLRWQRAITRTIAMVIGLINPLFEISENVPSVLRLFAQMSGLQRCSNFF
jgi:hypothetical protein